MTRTLIVLAGYLVLGFGFYFQAPEAPKPKPIVPVTAAQIKEGVRIEQRTKAYQRATRTVVRTLQKNGCSVRYANLIGITAVDYGLPPNLLAAVVFVESGCRAGAVSGRNSIGLMQVNPKVWGHRNELKDPERNLRIGASILASYVRRFGIIEGLHHYNGYSEVHGHEYVNKVLAAGQIAVM